MKVLTIKNPWAWLIIYGGKDIENRARKTNYRGRFAIHASLRSDEGAYLLEPDDPVMKAAFEAVRDRCAEIESTNGKIIGVAEIYNCTYPALTNIALSTPWAEPDASWHYWLKNAVPLAEPIPARGMLGFWDYRGL
jgi:hypothetical protein